MYVARTCDSSKEIPCLNEFFKIHNKHFIPFSFSPKSFCFWGTPISKFGERSEQQIWETSRKWDKFRFLWVELYVGTAHSQKAKSAKITLNTTFKVIFYKCYFSYQYGKSKSAIRQTLLSLRDISPVRGISLALRFQFMIFKHGTV